VLDAGTDDDDDDENKNTHHLLFICNPRRLIYSDNILHKFFIILLRLFVILITVIDIGHTPLT